MLFERSAKSASFSMDMAKADALRGPLHNLRLALDRPTDARHLLSQQSASAAMLHSAESRAGSGCFDAVPLEPGQPLQMEIAANGDRWITVPGAQASDGSSAISTFGSEIDAALEVYLDCREFAKGPIARGDDNYGLQAVVALPQATHPLMLRVRNLGGGGIASIHQIRAVTVNGRVTRSDTAAPIANKRIEAFQGTSPANASYVGQATTQADGTYQLVTFFGGSSNTYVRTASSSFEISTVDEAWDNVVCSGSFGLSSCGPGMPTPVATADGVTVNNIQFALSPGATIYGQVVDRAGVAVRNAQVTANQIGAPQSDQRDTLTDETGRYRLSALRPGQFRVLATAQGHTPQVFRGFDCISDCGQIGGTPVNAVEFDVSRADFSLSRSGSIAVTVTVEGQPLDQTTGVELTVLNAAGNGAASGFASASQGTVSLGPLAAGSYRVRASGSGLVSEYYLDVECAAQCGPAEFQAAQPLAVSNDMAPVTIGMDLRRLPEVGGLVTDSNGAPIAGARIRLIRDFSEASVLTGTNGRYAVRPLAAGSHLVHASTPAHVDEAHSNVPCAISFGGSCPGATLVDLTAGAAVPPIDFQLDESPAISGRVTNLPASSQFDSIVPLTVGNAEQPQRGTFTQLADGRYTLTDLQSGPTRFGFSGSSSGRLQLFRDIDCGSQVFSFSQCPANGPTNLSLAVGGDIPGVDFSFVSRNGRQGRVTDAVTGLPLAGIIIDAFNVPTGARMRSATTDVDGRFDIFVDFGSASYFLATDNFIGYRNEVYSERECPVGSVYLGNCSLAGATPVAFPGTGSQILFTLRAEFVLFSSGFE